MKKRTVYVILSCILGIIASYLIHAIVEFTYLRLAVESGNQIRWYHHFGLGSCALHPVLQYTLLVVGIAGGYAIGRIWWGIVYKKKII